MNTASVFAAKLVSLAFLALLTSSPTLAQDDGRGHHGGPDSGDNRPAQADNSRSWGTDRQHQAPRNDFRFEDTHRGTVNEYYAPRFSAGNCPPGLARRNNGCAPPAYGRRWELGQQLPRGVTIYALPRDLAYRLPPPPSGQRYVRVGADILLITITNSLVIDAIQDIGGGY